MKVLNIIFLKKIESKPIINGITHFIATNINFFNIIIQASKKNEQIIVCMMASTTSPSPLDIMGGRTRTQIFITTQIVNKHFIHPCICLKIHKKNKNSSKSKS
jgi:hypothetical protein